LSSTSCVFVTQPPASLSFDAANRVVGFTYDARGNVLQDATYTYTWDAYNRLTQVKLASTGAVVASYGYDADGMRQTATAGGVTTRVVVDAVSDEIVALVDTTGAVVTKFVRDAAGALVAMVAGSSAYTYLTNAHGDVTALVDAAGAVVARWTYDAWGKPTEFNAAGTPVPVGTAGNPFLFAGYFFDVATGLYYLRARYYDPKTGRFLSMDPEPGKLTDRLSQNPYIYCQNDPVNLADPTGRAVVQGTGVGPKLTTAQQLKVEYSGLERLKKQMRLRREEQQKAAARRRAQIARANRSPMKKLTDAIGAGFKRHLSSVKEELKPRSPKEIWNRNLGHRFTDDVILYEGNDQFSRIRTGVKTTRTTDAEALGSRHGLIRVYEEEGGSFSLSGDVTARGGGSVEAETLWLAPATADNVSLKAVGSCSSAAPTTGKLGFKARVGRGLLNASVSIGAEGLGASIEFGRLVERNKAQGTSMNELTYVDVGLKPQTVAGVVVVAATVAWFYLTRRELNLPQGVVDWVGQTAAQ